MSLVENSNPDNIDWKHKPTLGNYKNENDKFNVYDNCSVKDLSEYGDEGDIICYKPSYSAVNGYNPNYQSVNNLYETCIKKIVTKGTIHPLGNKNKTPQSINLELKDHQKRILYEMLKREDYEYRLLDGQNLLFLCDNVGSGKTISILSLIAERPQVKQVWSNRYYLPRSKLTKYDQEKYKIAGVIFDKELTVFNSNLLIIPHGIFSQWDKYIGENTTIKYYSIGTKKQMKLTKDEYNKVLNENSIICIKSTMVKDFVNILNELYGEVSTNIIDSHNDKMEESKTTNITGIVNEIRKEAKQFVSNFQSKPTKSIMDSFLNKINEINDMIDYKKLSESSNIYSCDEAIHIKPSQYNESGLNGYMFQRVIIDEADSIHIPAFPYIYGKYTWFVTSSINNLLFPHKKNVWNSTTNKYETISNGIKGTGLIKDSLFYAVDWSRRTNSYYKGYNSCRIFKAIVRNHLKFIKESIYIPKPIVKYHKCFTPPELLAVTNAINKDALKALNAGDVKKAMAMIGCESTTEDDILKSVNKKLYKELEESKENLENRKKDLRTTEDSMESIKVMIQSAKEENFDEEFIIDLTEQRNYLSSRMSTLKASIKKWNDNISGFEAKIKGIEERVTGCENKTCPICACNVTSPALTPCCKNVFCMKCISMSLDYSKECPMCRNPLQLSKLNIIVSEKVNSDGKDTVLPTKIQNIIKLLEENPDKRVMIFSEFTNAQAFIELKDKLKEMNIKYEVPYGSSGRISNIIKRYKEDKEHRVLLLNANCFGAGLNLQFTDEIYIFHRMSVDLENQVIGRAQRMGRTTALNIHYMCYENEYPESYDADGKEDTNSNDASIVNQYLDDSNETIVNTIPIPSSPKIDIPQASM